MKKWFKQILKIDARRERDSETSSFASKYSTGSSSNSPVMASSLPSAAAAAAGSDVHRTSSLYSSMSTDLLSSSFIIPIASLAQQHQYLLPPSIRHSKLPIEIIEYIIISFLSSCKQDILKTMILCRPIAKICVAILWRDPIPLSLLHLDWLFDQWIISDIDNGGGGGGNDEYTTKSPASTSRRGSVLFSGNEAIHHQKRRNGGFKLGYIDHYTNSVFPSVFIPAAAPASNNNDSKRRDSTVSQATRQSSQKRNSFIAAANNSTPSGGRHSILNRPAGITSPIFVFEPPPLYPYFHLIQHIEADASDQLETSLIYKLFKVCPNLRSLVIKSLFSFSDDVFLKHIVPFMPRLESLSLHCTGLSEKSIDSLLKYCHKIHSIAIYAPMPASFYRKWLVCNTTSVLRLITSIYFTQSSFETGEQADQIAKLFADAGNLKHIGFSGGESCVKYATVFATAFKKAYNENQNAEVKATPSAAFSKNQPLRGKLQVTGIKTPVQRLIQQSVAVGGGSLGNLRSSHSNLTSGIPFSYSFSSMHSAIDWSSLAEFIEIIPQQAVKRLFLDCQIIMKHPESISPSMFPLFLESLELSAVCLPLFQNHSPNDIENNNNDISSNTPPHTNNLDSQIFKTLINLKRLKLHFNNHDLPFLDTDLAVVLSAVPCTLSQLEIIQNCKNPLGDECNTALLRFNRLSLIRIVGTEGLRVSTIYSLVQRNRTTLKRVHFFLIGNDVLGDELLRTCAIKTRNRRMSGGGAAVLDESAETATRMEMTLNEWGVRKLLRKISSNK